MKRDIESMLVELGRDASSFGHIYRDTRNMLEALGEDESKFAGITESNFGASYTDSTGRSLPCFNLPQDLTITLVSGYNIQMRHTIIKRWQELEALGEDVLKFEGIYLDAYSRSLPCFNLPKDLTITLVSGYNIQLRHAITKRWQELGYQPADFSARYIG